MEIGHFFPLLSEKVARDGEKRRRKVAETLQNGSRARAAWSAEAEALAREAEVRRRRHQNEAVTLRRQLLVLLADQPRSASSMARELGIRRQDVEEELRHAIRSAQAGGHVIDVLPARCKSCDFVFGPDRLLKPGRCPVCKGSRIVEAMIRAGARS